MFPNPFQIFIKSLYIECDLLKFSQSMSDRDYVTQYELWAY